MTDPSPSDKPAAADAPQLPARGGLPARLLQDGKQQAAPPADADFTTAPAPAPPQPSRQPPPAARRPVWLRPIQRTVLVAVLVAGVLFLVWQARVLTEQDAVQSLHTAVVNALPEIAAPLNQARAAVAKAADAPLVAVLAQPQGAELARRMLRERLPNSRNVAVYRVQAQPLMHGDLSELGYVRAAQLARAQDSGQPQVSVVRHGAVNSVSVVQPLTRSDQVVAYAAVELPFAPVAQAFARLSLPRGRVALRAGGEDHSPVLLERGHSAHRNVDDAVAIAHTHLWLTDSRPPSASVLPAGFPPWLAWALAFACLLGALLLAAGERRLRAVSQRLEERRARGVGEPTLGEVIKDSPPPRTRTPAAAPATEAAGVGAHASAPPPGVAVTRGIFRAYDIRGIMGKTLDAGVAWQIGQAIGSAACDQHMTEIVVGRDGRLSGPELVDALCGGLRASGIDVIDLGAVPTPVVYFACFQLDTGCGVAVTGSHNPPDYNGFKVVIDGVTLAGDAIQELFARIAEGRFSEGRGSLRQVDVTQEYIERIASDVQIERPLKIVVDCGNGITGGIAPRLLEAIGAEVSPLYDEVDGHFPNHHPDPSDPKNLGDLMLAVKHQEADLGIAFDGDGDRLGVVTRNAEIIYPDRVLMLFAIDVLTRDPGATIIYDVKCTGHLQSLILRRGGSPLMSKTGHSLIKAKMRETGAALAGEMSGHFFFAERWYGFDDGMYAAARLLEILAADPDQRAPEEIFAALPNGVSTPELHLAIDDAPDFIDSLLKSAQFEGARLTTIDGLRADWPDGWGLVRASNTTPVLVMRFDADDSAALERIEGAFRTQMLALEPGLNLPF